MAGPFLQQRMLEIGLGESHLGTEGDYLFFGETVADIAGTGLQLGGTVKDPIQRGAIESGGKAAVHRDQPGNASTMTAIP